MSASAPPAAPWYRTITPEQWRVLIAAKCGWMLDALDFMLYAMALGQLRAYFEFGDDVAGLLGTITLVMSGVGGLLFGYVADRFGRTRALMATIVIFSLASLGASTSQSVLQLLFLRAVLGIGMGGEWASGGVLAGGVGLKVAAVVAAAGVTGGVGIAGSSEIDKKPAKADRVSSQSPGVRLGQVAPRGVSVPGNGVARGKLSAPGQTKVEAAAKAKARAKAAAAARRARAQAQKRKAAARGQAVSAQKRAASAERKATKTPQGAAQNANGQQPQARGAPEPKAAESKQTKDMTPPPTTQTTPEATSTGATQPNQNTSGPTEKSSDKAGGPKEK